MHVFTKEEQQRGVHAKTPFKALAASLRMRRKCATSCLFFDTCPVSAISYGHRDEDPAKDRKCLMKEFPETVRQQFINLFLTGEEGIIKEIKLLMHNYLNDVEAYGTLRDKKDALQLMITFYDKVFNQTRKGGEKKEPLTITIRRVGMEPQTLEIKPRVALPEGFTGKDLNNALRNPDITEGDPESLVNSPILDEIVRLEKPQPRPIYMEEIKIETNFEQIMEENDE